MINIVLFGAPGCGKGTQAQRLKAHYGIEHVSTGEVIRDEIRRGTELGRSMESYIKAGKLAPDQIVIGMIANYVAEHKHAKGCIFDGFPRTTVQAEEFDKILAGHGLKVDVMIDIHVPEEELVRRISAEKARAVREQAGMDAVVIAADTVVALDGAVLGKPADELEAFKMLSTLSGCRHQVYTGLTVLRGEERHTVSEETTVAFRELSEEEISCYIQTGEPMDKAGAYGIQGFGALLIEGIQGDYYNVMGLPVCRGGLTVPFDEDEALRRFESPEIAIDVDLGAGDAAATVWTCDFSHDYVTINGDYRS